MALDDKIKWENIFSEINIIHNAINIYTYNWRCGVYTINRITKFTKPALYFELYDIKNETVNIIDRKLLYEKLSNNFSDSENKDMDYLINKIFKKMDYVETLYEIFKNQQELINNKTLISIVRDLALLK